MRMPSEHAVLAASASHRWLECPGSIELSKMFSETGSAYTEEGSLAHSMAEEAIGRGGKVSLKLKRQIRAFYEEHPELNGSYEAMEDTVMPYVEWVWEEQSAMRKADSGTLMMTEVRLDLTDYIPEGFGTSDVMIFNDDIIEVIDLKYGKGVPVSAENNPQLKIYALGALSAVDGLVEPKKVKMVIYQPRLDNISVVEMPVKELLKWAKDVLIPGAKLAMTKDAPLKYGEHCRFCPARAKCRVRAEAMEEIADMRCGDILTPEEIAVILTVADDVKKWIDEVKEAALADALNGEEIPGFKIVEGRSNRKIDADEATIIGIAEAEGFSEDTIYERKLKGISALESLMGKKRFAEAFKAVIVKPEGKPVLVPESDKREAINIAAKAFEGEMADE